MDVNCPACAARYKADEHKLRGKTARMRCRACDTVWLVSGPADEIKTNDSKHAAVVKRGAEREHRDLFATRPPDLGSSYETPVKQTLRPPPPDSQLSGMAARNETSVLFTVDALRGNARLNTPAPEQAPLSGFIVEDDEGIIDLNALASTPPTRMGVGNRSVAPLFASEPPPGAFAADVSHSGADPSYSAGGFRFGKRAIAGVAAAAVALVLCAIGVSAAFKGEEPIARAAANTMITPPPVVAPTPAVEPAPATDPAPAAATSSNDDDDDTKPARTGKKKGRKGGAKASSAHTQKVQSSGVSGTGVAKTVPKASDKCHCKGDFNCILRCTATGK